MWIIGPEYRCDCGLWVTIQRRINMVARINDLWQQREYHLSQLQIIENEIQELQGILFREEIHVYP